MASCLSGGRADGQGCHFSTRPTHPSGAIRFNLQAIRWQPVSAELGSVGEFYESGCCFQPTPVGGRRVSERPLPGEKGAPRPGQGHVGVLGLSSPGAERPLSPSDGSRRQEGGRGPLRSHGVSSSADERSLILARCVSSIHPNVATIGAHVVRASGLERGTWKLM